MTVAAVTSAALGVVTQPRRVVTVVHPRCGSALRAAQLELFCDHDAAAMTALREARRVLVGETSAEAQALAAVDEAAWHVRHHKTQQAQTAIAKARGRLA